MSELSLVYPMLALVLLTFVVLIALFRSRVRMVREGLAPVSYFRTFQGSVVEPEYHGQARAALRQPVRGAHAFLCRAA